MTISPPRALLLGVVGVAALVRLVPCWTELWLDEVWTLDLVAEAGSLLGVLTERHHDNNHLLYSLYLHLVGPLAPEWVLRLPAWLAGVGSLVLAGAIAGQVAGDAAADETEETVWNPTAAWLAALLCGGSYFLLHYASETRGYTLSACFALLALYALLRGRGERRWAVLYWVALALGLLAHPIAVHVALACGLASCVLWAKTRPPREAALLAARWHGVPLVFAILFYVAFLRRMVAGGGPDYDLLGVLAETAAYGFNVPLAAGPLALGLALVALGAGLALLRRRVDLLLLFAVGVVLSPLLLNGIRGAPYYHRYFFLNVQLLLILSALPLARLWQAGGRARRGVVVTSLLAFGVGGAWHTAPLLRQGRGHYRDALARIAAESPPGPVAVGGDHDFRQRKMVAHYTARAAPGRELRYVRREAWPAGGVDWLLHHQRDDATPPPEEVRGERGGTYRLVGRWGSARLSGWSLFLYRNARDR